MKLKMSLLVFLTLASIAASGCAFLFGEGEKEPKKVAAYQPSFTYAARASESKVDVTIGLVNPQFTGDGVSYWQQNQNDEVVRNMVRALKASFNSLLVTKGFSVAGPFDSINDMTFPEKRGSDVVLYAELDVNGGYHVTNVRKDVDYGVLGATEVVRCDVRIAPSGSVQLIANEPMTGEKVWVKRIDVTQPPINLGGTGQVCAGKAVTQEIRNAWGQAHEALYKMVMGALDRYVTADEFVVLKQQAADLKSRKGY